MTQTINIEVPLTERERRMKERDEKIHARYLELMKTGLSRASTLRVLRAEFPFDSRATVYAILARMGDPYRKPAGASGK